MSAFKVRIGVLASSADFAVQQRREAAAAKVCYGEARELSAFCVFASALEKRGA
jgi:hypothetical protein